MRKRRKVGDVVLLKGFCDDPDEEEREAVVLGEIVAAGGN